MEFQDLWNEDFLLAQDWDMPVEAQQTSGLLDDFKSLSHPDGGLCTTKSAQDDVTAFQGLSDDLLGFELGWMGESSDIGSLLAELETGVASEQLPDPPAEVIAENSSTCNSQPDLLTAPIESVIVEPVTNIEIDENVVILSEHDLIKFNEASTSLEVELDISDYQNLTNSYPTSPESSVTSENSIIESSPELFKVFSSAVPLELNTTSKSSPKSSSIGPIKQIRRKKPAQPVPEHVIMGQSNKKDRKKLQNKNAAIRYRNKKKEEAMSIVGEEQDLEEKNVTLKTKVGDLQREINYMKNLLDEICKAKGIKFEI